MVLTQVAERELVQIHGVSLLQLLVALDLLLKCLV